MEVAAEAVVAEAADKITAPTPTLALPNLLTHQHKPPLATAQTRTRSVRKPYS